MTGTVLGRTDLVCKTEKDEKEEEGEMRDKEEYARFAESCTNDICFCFIVNFCYVQCRTFGTQF